MWGKKDERGRDADSGSDRTLAVADPSDDQTNGAEVRSLALLSQAKQALAQVNSFEEIKEIRDKAEAARKYIESAQLGLAMQNQAAELKIRAEREAGRLLAKLKLNGGDRRSENAGDKLRLEDLGVTKHQSSRWQREAAVPEDVFDKYVAQITEKAEELTTAAVLRLSRQYVGKKKNGQAKGQNATPDQQDVLGFDELRTRGESFACIYANPPRASDADGRRGQVQRWREAGMDSFAAEASHLHLWSPYHGLPEALELLEQLGFSFGGSLAWIQPSAGRGPYWRPAHELLLLGVRGELKFQEKLRSYLDAGKPPKGQKPEKVRAAIARVSPGPHLELWARKPVPNWVCAEGPASK